MKRHRISNKSSIEDATSQGGWLFADSFLALMVIFLATISFVPVLSTSPDQAIGSSANYKKAFVLVFDDYDPLKLQTEITNFMLAEELPDTSRVIYAEFLGGYDDSTENKNDGSVRGLNFAVKVKQEGIKIFSDARLNAGASPSIKPGQVLVRLTFAMM